jgi:hypothetical protein
MIHLVRCAETKEPLGFFHAEHPGKIHSPYDTGLEVAVIPWARFGHWRTEDGVLTDIENLWGEFDNPHLVWGDDSF